MSPLPYCLAYLIPGLVVLGYYGGGVFNYATVVFTFGLVPLLDMVIGVDRSNATQEQLRALGTKFSFRLVLLLYVPIQVALVIWGAAVVSRGEMSAFELIGFVAGTGVATGGIGITVAHELLHKKNRLDQLMGKALLLTVSYMHFFIEHTVGHHVRVATPQDPATARLGESFYAFYPRTLFGSFVSAWKIEKRRLQRKGLPELTLHNQMLWFISLPIAFAAGLWALFGWTAALFFFAQSIIAFTLLELVNYIEHYGLLRRRKHSGAYEQVAPAHSWNANHRLTNYFLFKLQRHADHHIHPVRPYQTLRHFDESPQLPTGYAGMLLLALVPPLWRRVMDARVIAFRERG